MPGKTIHGHAIVFDRWSLDLGGFRERISAQAIDRTLRGGEDLRALWNHQPDQLLARMSAGTLRVAKDRHGLVTEIDLPTSRGDIAELVERRDVSGMSFSFMTLSDSWSDGALPERTILDMLVREVSPVTWPAYPQTAVAIQAPTLTGRALPSPKATGGFVMRAEYRDAIQRALTWVEDRAMEYAMERDGRGERVAHSAAQASLERFLAARAERPDKDGLIYRSVYRDGQWRGEWVPRVSVVDVLLKQAEDRARAW